MNENAAGKLINELKERYDEELHQSAIDFLEEQQDPIIIQLNAAEAEMEGLHRQKNALQKVESMIVELSENYLLFRRKEISKTEYGEQELKIKYEWQNYIGDQLMYGVTFTSGTALQYIQQIRSLGILKDDQDGRIVDAEVIKQNTILIDRLRSLLEFLQNMGISVESLDPAVVETTDWNDLLNSMVVLQESTVRALSIIRKNHRRDSTPLAQDEILIEDINHRLSTDLHIFFKLYSKQQCSFPSGVSLIMMRSQLHRRVLEAKREVDDFDSKYWELMEKAHELGYQRDNTTGLYHKVTDVS